MSCGSSNHTNANVTRKRRPTSTIKHFIISTSVSAVMMAKRIRPSHPELSRPVSCSLSWHNISLCFFVNFRNPLQPLINSCIARVSYSHVAGYLIDSCAIHSLLQSTNFQPVADVSPQADFESAFRTSRLASGDECDISLEITQKLVALYCELCCSVADLRITSYDCQPHLYSARTSARNTAVHLHMQYTVIQSSTAKSDKPWNTRIKTEEWTTWKLL